MGRPDPSAAALIISFDVRAATTRARRRQRARRVGRNYRSRTDPVKVPRWLAVVALILAIGVSVAVTLLISGGNESDLPPGCAPQDRGTPGCRSTNTGSDSNTVALVTVILTPLAALAVGLIAAASARNRLREQLHAEGNRLRQQLDGEAEREKTRHEHERRLHDLDGLRELINDAATAMQARVIHVVETRGLLRGKSGPLDVETEKALRDAHQTDVDLRKLTVGTATRLLLHFGPDSELYSHYYAHGRALEEQLAQLWENQDLPAEERLFRSEDEVLSSAPHFEGFREAARRVVGYRLPEE